MAHSVQSIRERKRGSHVMWRGEINYSWLILFLFLLDMRLWQTYRGELYHLLTFAQRILLAPPVANKDVTTSGGETNWRWQIQGACKCAVAWAFATVTCWMLSVKKGCPSIRKQLNNVSFHYTSNVLGAFCPLYFPSLNTEQQYDVSTISTVLTFLTRSSVWM